MRGMLSGALVSGLPCPPKRAGAEPRPLPVSSRATSAGKGRGGRKCSLGMLARQREMETPRRTTCGSPRLGWNWGQPSSVSTGTPVPPCDGDQPQGGQATLFQGIVMAKHCVGLVEVGGTQGEMARSGEAERNESGKEKEGKAAGLEHLTQRFSVLTDSLLWKLQLDKVSRCQ